jgi:hypothetical protein
LTRAWSRRPPARGGALLSFFVVAAVALAPARSAALEPRYDHRDQQGPTAELLFAKDVIWSGSETHTSSRGAVRVGWGFDPTGDGNELFFGSTLTVAEAGEGPDQVRLTFDTRFRACVGTEEFKTLLDIGLWGSAADRFAAGPLVGLGFMYDFNRNFGLLASGFLAAGIGDVRVVSFGGGVGVQLRYE